MWSNNRTDDDGIDSFEQAEILPVYPFLQSLKCLSMFKIKPIYLYFEFKKRLSRNMHDKNGDKYRTHNSDKIDRFTGSFRRKTKENWYMYNRKLSVASLLFSSVVSHLFLIVVETNKKLGPSLGHCTRRKVQILRGQSQYISNACDQCGHVTTQFVHTCKQIDQKHTHHSRHHLFSAAVKKSLYILCEAIWSIYDPIHWPVGTCRDVCMDL